MHCSADAGEAFDSRAEVFFISYDYVIGPNGCDEISFRGGSRGRDDVRARVLSQLNRVDAGAAACGRDHDGLAGLEFAESHQAAPRSHVLHPDRGCLFDSEMLRHGHECISFSCDDLAEHLKTKIRDLQSLLTSSPLIAKQFLRKHIAKITLTPTGKGGWLNLTVDFTLGGSGDSGVMLTGTLESFSQQYGFSTITITGVLLETSRVRRKTRTVLQPRESEGASQLREPMLVVMGNDPRDHLCSTLPRV